MAFWNLFRKEVKSIFPLYAVFAVAIVVLHVVILLKNEALETDTALGLSIFVPYPFLACMAIGTGYYQLHVEWRTNSIYLLLSLPIRGWKVLTAKLAAVVALLLLTSVWIGASFAILLLRVKWDELTANLDWSKVEPGILNLVWSTFWMSLFVIIFLLIIVQFTFLCGQLVAKFKWLVMLSAFFGILWLVLRISPVLSQLLAWTPEFTIGHPDIDMAFLHSGPFIVLGLLCIGLIALNGFIFEKEVEV